MTKVFMLDIEASGVDPKIDEVLQIAIVEMNFSSLGTWDIGREFNFYQHTDKEPASDFAKKHLAEIYKICREKPYVKPEEVRQSILKFFSDCGAISPNIFLCGWNAGIFDLPFLSYHGYLCPAGYQEGKLQGDCHYRIYELSGALHFFANVRGTNELNPFINEALKKNPLPKGARHDALYDCKRQIHILNGLLLLERNQNKL